jgi:hypothetical protein
MYINTSALTTNQCGRFQTFSQASKADTSLFILSYGGALFYLLVYIDDILLTGSNSELLHKLINLLSSEFKLRDLGMVHYFLGIEVKPTSMGMLLSQQKYATDIIRRASMSSCKPVDTPFFCIDHPVRCPIL